MYCIESQMLETVQYGGPRYYDKTVNIVVDPRGRSGVLFEHTAADGVAALKFSHELAEAAREVELGSNNNNPSAGSNCKLEFKLTTEEEKMLGEIENKTKDGEVSSADAKVSMDPDVLALLREQGVTDMFMFASVLLAMETSSVGSKGCLIVEPCHVGHFHHGRVDPVFPLTEEAKALVRAVAKGEVNPVGLSELFGQAFLRHKSLIKAAKAGAGVGPHIAAIRSLGGDSIDQILLP